MTLVWVGSPNFQKGREGLPPTDIVLHWMDGPLRSADATFLNRTSEVSAHYGIENRVEHHYVHDADTAWHAGTHVENLKSIGIEHSAQPGRPASAQTITTSVNRMVTLIRANPTLSADRIYPHKRFVATQCPGTIPIAAMIARVKAILNPPHPYLGLTQLGSSGSIVKQVQTRLNLYGYHLIADGTFGPKTVSAVRGFQTAHHLTVDGKVGPATWSRLWA